MAPREGGGERIPRAEARAVAAMGPRARDDVLRARVKVRWDRIALLSALTASLALLFFTYFRTGVFRVSEVRVIGNRRLDAAYVISRSGIDHRDNVLMLDAGEVVGRLEGEPWIKKARVMRRFPDAVELIVEEREAVAQVASGRCFLLTDLEGFLLELSDSPWVGYPRLELHEEREMEVGGKLVGDDFLEYAEVLGAMSPDMLLRAETLGCDARRGIYLLTGEGVRIFLGGSDDLQLKLENAFAIMDDCEVRKKYPRLDYVDVSCPDEPVISPRSS